MDGRVCRFGKGGAVEGTAEQVNVYDNKTLP